MGARGRPAPQERVTGRSALSACLMVCLMALPAWAQKTDIVTLVNGDTLTCEIKLLDRGRLQVSTDHLGTVNIEWDKVVAVTAARLFQVETSNGVRLLGQLATRGPGEFDVIAAEGTFPVDRDAVVYIAPIARGFWRRLDGSFDFGLSYTQSSGVAAAEPEHQRHLPPAQLPGDGIGHQLLHPAGGCRRHLQKRRRSPRRPAIRRELPVAGAGRLRAERGIGIRAPGTVSGGLGRFLIRSNRSVFGVGAGLSTSTELPIEGDSVQYLDALLSMRQSFFTYDYPKTDITMALDVYPGLSQWGRVRAQFDGKIKREIVHDFSVGFTIYDSYDNRPPSADAVKNDVGLSLTIGWTF